jgi:hypothetical protein
MLIIIFGLRLVSLFPRQLSTELFSRSLCLFLSSSSELIIILLPLASCFHTTRNHSCLPCFLAVPTTVVPLHCPLHYSAARQPGRHLLDTILLAAVLDHLSVSMVLERHGEVRVAIGGHCEVLSLILHCGSSNLTAPASHTRQETERARRE